MNNKDYQEYAQEKIPKPTYLKNIIYAFIVGGIICTIGQLIRNFLFQRGLNEEAVATGTSIILIFIGASLTGLGVYDEIGKVGGAGATIPITGFSNAIVSSALEFKNEGFIFGVAAKMLLLQVQF